MFPSYEDITDKIDAKPTWWIDGVPRYAPFHPRMTSVYAREAALLRIRCQACQTVFDVAMTHHSTAPTGTLKDYLRRPADQISVGDPPNTGCCDVGPTMTADVEAVLEFWSIDLKTYKWERDTGFAGSATKE